VLDFSKSKFLTLAVQECKLESLTNWYDDRELVLIKDHHSNLVQPKLFLMFPLVCPRSRTDHASIDLGNRYSYFIPCILVAREARVGETFAFYSSKFVFLQRVQPFAQMKEPRGTPCGVRAHPSTFFGLFPTTTLRLAIPA
jgi:hypothetical protein